MKRSSRPSTITVKKPRPAGRQAAVKGSADGHRQVWLTTPEGEHVHADTGLARALVALWKRGIHTFMSCQGGVGEPGFLAFDSGAAADAFLALTLPQTWEWSFTQGCGSNPGLKPRVDLFPGDIQLIERAMEGVRPERKGIFVAGDAVVITVDIVELSRGRRVCRARKGDRCLVEHVDQDGSLTLLLRSGDVTTCEPEQVRLVSKVVT